MTQPLILSAVRTPIGKYLGSLADVPVPQLAAATLKESLIRGGATAASIDEVILGQVLQAGVGQAPARQAALAARLPATVAALTVNKVCGSGLKAVMLAAQAIRVRQTGGRSADARDSDRAVERHDGRRIDRDELVVQLEDQRPVERVGRNGARVGRRDIEVNAEP